MKKINIVFILLILTGIMQAQDRTQPKPGKSPVVNIKKPQSFVLPNGLKVMIVENNKLPRVSYNLTLDNAPFVEGNKTAKKAPVSIGLIWDNSLSCKNRDLKKELDLLDAYFQKIKNTKVTLYFLNYTFGKRKEFVVSDGNWSELKTVLEKFISFSHLSEYSFAGL